MWEHCTNKDFKSENTRFPLSNFVEPFIQKEDGNVIEFNYIDNWLVSDHNPILVFKGSGGIGKTTVAKHVASLVYEKYPFSTVIFIDFQQIVNELIRISRDNTSLDLYQFYEANHTSNNINK